MKKILSSVGLRGVNRRDDVRRVQELLNLVPHADGGPLTKLATDGLCGRKTNGAIEKLQAHERGWRRVTTRVEPDSPTWKLLQGYDQVAQSSAGAAAPQPPKVVGCRFIIMMAASPGQQLDTNTDNFYFLIMDQANQTQKALYYFGNMDVPPPQPTPWSMTNPPIITTPKPIGVADWAGTAVFFEKSRDGSIRTEIWIVPEVLNNQTIRFEIHAHLDRPQPGTSSSSFSAPFRLREVSPNVTL